MSDHIVDDLTISDDEGLLRRVPNLPNMFKVDHNTGKTRPSSVVFSDRADGIKLSVTLESPLLKDSSEYSHAIKQFPGFGLLKLTAGFVRHQVKPAQMIQRDPTADDPHHALVIGDKSKATCQAMAKAAIWKIKPIADSK